MPKKKKCASEQLSEKCDDLIKDEEDASTEYYGLSLHANSIEERERLEKISAQEAKHAKDLKKMCKCKK